MRLLTLALILTQVIGLLFLGLEFYFLKEWYLHKGSAYSQESLIWAVAILGYFALIKTFILLLFQSDERLDDGPEILKSDSSEKVRRPDGSVIHIDHFGIKGNPAIILIHGWNSNRLQWYYQVKYFRKNFHLILIDLAGLGESERPKNNDYSLAKLAADLDAVIKQTKPMNPVLWGHSIGGMCILTFWKLYNDNHTRIRSIILQHTTCTNPLKTIIFSPLLLAIEKPILKPLCWLLIFLSPVLILFRWFSYYTGSLLIMTRILVFAGTQTSRQLDYISRLAAMASPAVLARGVLGMFNYEATDILASIDVPTLIISGDRDILTRPEASVRMHKTIEHSGHISLVPSGHMGLVERHGEVNRSVEIFLHG
jgi:pimeloyl-ACP methyl ester carboxylesterase